MATRTKERRTDNGVKTEWRQDRFVLDPSEGLGKVVRTDEGFMLVEAYAAKPGVMEYSDGVKTWREYVPPEELHREDSLMTLGRKPITLEHPEDNVDPSNIGQLGVGDLGDDVKVVSNGYVKVQLAVRRGDAIQAVHDGKTEVSPGYTAEIDWTPGVHPEFGAYDAIQRNRRYNHLAIVDVARGGPEIRLRADSGGAMVRVVGRSDTTPPPRRAPMNPILTFLLGLGVARTDAESAVPQIEAIAASRRGDGKSYSDEEIEKMKDEAFKAGEKKATDEYEQKKKDEEDEEEEEPKMDSIPLDQRVAWHNERAGLVAAAKSHLGDTDVSKMDNASIREAVVRKVDSDTPVDASADYIQAAYNLLGKRTDSKPAPEVDPYSNFHVDSPAGDGGPEGRNDAGNAPKNVHDSFLKSANNAFEKRRADSLARQAPTDSKK